MFVVGIDPGLSRCGYCCLRAGRPTPRVLAMGVLSTSPDLGLPRRLAELQQELADLYDELTPDVVAIEQVFFQVNVRTAMSVGQASGLAIAEAAGRGAEVVQYTPNQVKATVTGDGAADKAQVQQMVQRLLGLRRPPGQADAADAAALALCHLAHVPGGQPRAVEVGA